MLAEGAAHRRGQAQGAAERQRMLKDPQETGNQNAAGGVIYITCDLIYDQNFSVLPRSIKISYFNNTGFLTFRAFRMALCFPVCRPAFLELRSGQFPTHSGSWYDNRVDIHAKFKHYLFKPRCR